MDLNNNDLKIFIFEKVSVILINIGKGDFDEMSVYIFVNYMKELVMFKERYFVRNMDVYSGRYFRDFP